MKRKRIDVLQFNAIFQEETDGGYSVWIPNLPGCCSQGETFDEALKNIKQAIELYLEEAPAKEKDFFADTGKQFLVPVQISYA